MKHTLDKYPTKERYAVMDSGGTKPFDELKKGDSFILLEAAGDFVEHRGEVRWVALEDAKDGVILCESIRT